MDAKTIFDLNPDLQEVWQVGSSEAFEDEEEAKNYANHFNVSMKKVYRTEVRGLKEVKKKEPKKSKKAESEESGEATE